MKKLKSEDKICKNCKYIVWMIGIGQGVKCNNTMSEYNNKLIPKISHTCNFFEKK
jgi:hypothetical protein